MKNIGQLFRHVKKNAIFASIGLSLIFSILGGCVTFVTPEQIEGDEYETIAELATYDAKRQKLTMPSLKTQMSLNDKVSHEVDCVATSFLGNSPGRHFLFCEKESKGFEITLDFTNTTDADWLNTRYGDNSIYHPDNAVVRSEEIVVSGRRINADIISNYHIRSPLYTDAHFNKLPRHVHFKNTSLADFEQTGISIQYPFDVKLLAELALVPLSITDPAVLRAASSANTRFSKMARDILIGGFGKEDSYELKFDIPATYIKAWNIATQQDR